VSATAAAIAERLARALSSRAPAEAAPDVLDAYGRTAPTPQLAIDIFKGGWSSQFPAEFGVQAGVSLLFEDPGLQHAIALVGGIEGLRILELGPLEGAHSYSLEKAGAQSVLAIEACVMSYLKCLIVKELAGLQRVSFKFGNFVPFLETTTERFDLIVASGVLYHQREPLQVLEAIARRTDRVYLWTHYYQEGHDADRIKADDFTRVPGVRLDGFACDLFRLEYDTYLPHGKYRGGVHDHSHWMKRDDLLACLRHVGLTDIEIMAEQTVHPFGPNLTVLARRPAATRRLPPAEDEYGAELRGRVGPPSWCVESVSLTGDQLAIGGWAIPIGGDARRVSIRIDGVEVEELEGGLHRPDVATYYWFLPGAEHSGFRGVHRVGAPPAGYWTIEYADRDTGQIVNPWHSFYVNRNDLLGDVPLPSLAQIRRVHGGNSQTQYLIEGHSIYVKFERALQSVAGRRFAEFGTILDFGCGCGRLARYFTVDSARHLIGADVDRDNVEWCRANLAGDFLVNALNPPLPLEPGSVDCVVANDVVNHFREADGRAWLREIARVCRQGAIGLVSVASESALARAHLGAGHDAQIRGLDFVDLSRNPELDEVIEDPTWYRNVFHSHAYIRAQWPREGFAILGIIPGVSGNQNDLVILRKR
jgi:SAM-dependent methyltransferase